MLKEILKEVTRIMKPYPVYAVGGCVRDYVMGNDPNDYDFCTSASPDEIEQCIKSKSLRAYVVGKRFGTLGCKVKVGDKHHMVEITTFRTEKYTSGNRKPEVSYVETINEDLNRRDFTINAMAIRLMKDNRIKIIDPFDGQNDIKCKILRCVGNSKTRFKEDPLRILRGIRFASRFGFMIEDKTADRMRKMGIKLLEISKERWMMELDKMLLDPSAADAVDYMFYFGVFKYMIPELSLQYGYVQNSKYHKYSLDIHTTMVIKAAREGDEPIEVLWAALLHDIAKPFVRSDKHNFHEFSIMGDGSLDPAYTIKTNYIDHEILGAEMVERIAKHLKWSNDRREKVVDLVRNHLNDDCVLRKYDNMGK